MQEKKRICGVRFCGGCNPRYDRGIALEDIKARLEGSVQCVIAEEEHEGYDALLVIGGCTNCCADYEQFKVKTEAVKLWDISCLEDAAGKILALTEEK